MPKKTKKSFKDYYSAKQRNYLCDYPTFKVGGFSVLNLPTLHFKIHLFDYLKKIAYQMNSRFYTASKKSVAEIQALRGKEARKKYKVQQQQCRNPKCRQICKGFVFLKTHVMRKKQPKKCLQFYTQANYIEELKKKC